MMFEMRALAEDRQKHVAVLNRLMGFSFVSIFLVT